MVLNVRAVTRLAWARQRNSIQQWVRTRSPLIAAAVGVLLGALALLYGTARGWGFFKDALPWGWLIAAVTFIALTPDRAQDRRLVVVIRSLLWSIPLVVCLQQIGWHRLNLQEWDVLWVSALLTVVIGLELTTLTPIRLRGALRRLLDREVLRDPAKAADRLENDLERVGDQWSLIGGWVVAAATLIAFLFALAPSAPSRPSGYVALIFAIIFALIFPAMAGFVVGRRCGRMVGYGRLTAILNKRGVQLCVVPGHPDGAGGLEPIGAFYLHQSRIASVPAIFLAVWVLLMSLWGRYPIWGHYRQRWLGPYLALLALAILVEVLVFILPMWSVHAVMRKQKVEFLGRADRLSPKMATIQTRLQEKPSEDRDADKRQLTELVEQYKILENTPTWPIDQSIRRRFTLRNLGLLLPFVGYLVGHSTFWQQLSDVFKG
jgi:hypothetical protein